MQWSNFEWHEKRKILYSAAFVGVFLLIIAYPTYKFLFPAPTCSDQKQNGTEVGVDCGGACTLYCPFEVKAPSTIWAKAFIVTPGYYDMGAYVENPNLKAGIRNANYTIRGLDADGAMVTERSGVMDVPPASTFLVFEGGFALEKIPERVEIEWNKDDLSRWTKASQVESVIMSKNKVLKNTDTKPRLNATLVNTDPINDVQKTVLGAIIYDTLRHPIGVSRTYIDGLPKNGEADIFFTWPTRITKNPVSGICTTPVDTMLVFDRSGSMNIGRKTPPEPLTTAKNAAIAYVDSAELIDKIGLVSFATTVSSPIDYELSSEHEDVKSAIARIDIDKVALQYTNLGDAIKDATEELGSERYTKDAKKVIVALTDGITNRPLDPANPKNLKYAGEYGATQATNARAQGIEVYTIGLGKGTDEAYLRDRIASSKEQYYNAPTAADLQSIYKKIAESVCKPENFITDIVITPKAVFEGN